MRRLTVTMMLLSRERWVKALLGGWWFLLSLPLCAQESPLSTSNWQQAWQELMDDEGDTEEGGDGLDTQEWLDHLATHKIDINRATRDELEQLPFLSEQQIMDLQEYIDRYGPMRSMGELRMVRSMDYVQLRLLPFFVYVGESSLPAYSFPSLDSMLTHGRHELTAALRVPFDQRKGDRNGYLGYPYRHAVRYELRYHEALRAGIVGAQDAGEPFFAHKNRWGYDTYSYYIQIRRLGPIEQMVVGKYKLSMGMGLIHNNSFHLGKIALLQSLGRTTATLRPHASRTEADCFQGAAATLCLGSHLTMSTYASYRPIDATLNTDGTATTLLTSGYHRTPAEMQKKHNTHETDLGAMLHYHKGALSVGGTVAFTHLDRLLQPNRTVLYRRHQAHGHEFLNLGTNYAYHHARFHLSGETAINRQGALATLNTLRWRVGSLLSLTLLQRFYSYRYTSLHAHSLSDTGHTQNESGVLMGTQWSPLPRLTVQAYADWAYTPWARYQVSSSAYAADLFLSTLYTRGAWSLQGRYRWRYRQRDNSDHSMLLWHPEHRARLTLTHQNGGTWSWATRIDMASVARHQGLMLSQHYSYTHHNALHWQGIVAWFHAPSYDSRLSLYEPSLPYTQMFSNYYGHGLRMAVTTRYDVTPSLRLMLKLGHTHYFNRATIGTGLQQIAHRHQTDLDLLLRWQF